MLRQFQPDLGTALNAAGKPREWRLIPPEENGRPWVASHGDGRRILLFPARQVAARERLELLGFFGESPVPDGLPLADAALALQSAGFTSALAWGRGKWLFGRAVLVRRFLLDPGDGSPAQPLSVRELGLLRAFASHPGEVLSRDELLDEVWGADYVGGPRTLDQHVLQIRRKLGPSADRIETVHRAGYRYAAPAAPKP
ncbi:MAG: winged helix-turn-helix transcriptional regulator [Kiritimatiellae bacterium]|nr:winged helix-turn-helix transcriptional regulator [Kiritimatiellia bacterium]